MGSSWAIDGHFLQAASLLLVIVLIIGMFAWLIGLPPRRSQESKVETDETEHRKYSDDDFIGLD